MSLGLLNRANGTASIRVAVAVLGALSFMAAAPTPALAYRIHGSYESSDLPVPYHVNPSGLPFGLDMVHDAARKWSVRREFDFAFSYVGTTSGRKLDGINNFYMDGGRMGGGTLGLCWRYWSGGHMSGFDIALNGNKRWSRLRFLNTAIHEFGHAVGLEHSNDHRAVMNASGGSGDNLDDLHADDIAGARHLYGRRTSDPGTPNIPEDGDGSSSPPAVIPAEPVLVSPEGQLTNHQPTFVWRAVTGATSYDLAVDIHSRGGLEKQLRLTDLDGPSHQISVTLPAGSTFYWWVRSANDHGKSDWAGPLEIETQRQGPPAEPVLVSPEAQLTNHQPTFVWRTVTGATSYDLAVDIHSRGGLEKQLRLTDLDGPSHQITVTLPAGNTFYWWVRSANDHGKSDWAGPLTIETQRSGLGSVSGLAPTGSIDDASPSFSWAPAAEATHYELRVRDMDNQLWIHVENHKDTSYDASTALPRGYSYHWWVRPFKGQEAGEWSDASIHVSVPTTTRNPGRRPGLFRRWGRRRDRAAKADPETASTATPVGSLEVQPGGRDAAIGLIQRIQGARR